MIPKIKERTTIVPVETPEVIAIRDAEAAKYCILGDLKFLEQNMGRAFAAEVIKEMSLRYFVEPPKEKLPF